MNLNKTLTSFEKIRFHDCDPFNHLNNSRYIDYFVDARSNQLLDNYGLDVYQLARKEGVVWVAAHTQLAHLTPAFLMEKVTIETCLLSYSSKSLLFEAAMWNSDKTVLKALMWSKLVHFHLPTQKSHIHAEHLMNLFEQIVLPLSPDIDFETRTKNLRSKK